MTFAYPDQPSVYPQYRAREQTTLYLYRDREEGFGPPYDVYISDCELHEGNCEFIDMLKPLMSYDGYSVWQTVGCGPGEPVCMGIGQTVAEASWHGLYRSIQLDGWHGGDAFIPTIYPLKSGITQYKPTLKGKGERLLLEGIDSIREWIDSSFMGTPLIEEQGLWLCEAAQGRFTVHADYGHAVQELVEHSRNTAK